VFGEKKREMCQGSGDELAKILGGPETRGVFDFVHSLAIEKSSNEVEKQRYKKKTLGWETRTGLDSKVRRKKKKEEPGTGGGKGW